MTFHLLTVMVINVFFHFINLQNIFLSNMSYYHPILTGHPTRDSRRIRQANDLNLSMPFNVRILLNGFFLVILSLNF